VRAETNAVCVAQLSPVDFLLVHECAVGAGQIFEKQDLLHLDDPRMVGGDGEVFQAEIVVVLPSDREGRARDLEFSCAALRRLHEERR